jgi:heme-degrading monooxygenase HmoA
MIASLAEDTQLPADLDPEFGTRFRTWLAAQPGFCGGYHMVEPATGHAFSLTFWQDEQALEAVGRALRAGDGPADGRISPQSSPAAHTVQVAAVF